MSSSPAACPRLTTLGPLAQLRAGRLPRRIIQLLVGLVLYGVSMAMVIRAELGVLPWDVLHQGLAGQSGWSFGTVVIVTSLLVLVAWIPIRQTPGLGTVLNAVVIGVVVDIVLAHLVPAGSLLARSVLMVGGVLLNGVATACYIGGPARPRSP